MSATLTQAIKERYETVAVTGWPDFWSGVKPENTPFPNFVLEHQRERSNDEATGDGGVTRNYLLGRVRMKFFAESVNATDGLLQAEELSQDLWAAMENGPLTIGADTAVWLKERDYGWVVLRRRGPNGGYVFQADTVYVAMFQP